MNSVNNPTKSNGKFAAIYYDKFHRLINRMDICSVTSHRRFKIDQTKFKVGAKPSDETPDIASSKEKVFARSDRSKAVRRIELKRVSMRRKYSEKFVNSCYSASSTINKSEISVKFI